jgi:fumarate hydratase class II
MPGKVNPTQSEAVTMVCAQVMGNDTTIAIAGSQGHFELNVFKPVIINAFLQSATLLGDVCNTFNEYCIAGITANKDKIHHNLNGSLMLVTALNRHIGYENAAKIAKKAYNDNTSLKTAALSLGLVTEKQYDEWIDAAKMIKPDPV